MSEAIMLAISLAFSIPTFIFLFIRKIIRQKNYVTKFIEKAKQQHTIATGVWIKTRTLLGTHQAGDAGWLMNDRIRVTYQYVVGDKKYKKKQTFPSDEMASSIKIYYKESNPRKAYCDRDGYMRGGSLVFIVPFIMTAVIFNLLRYFIK